MRTICFTNAVRTVSLLLALVLSLKPSSAEVNYTSSQSYLVRANLMYGDTTLDFAWERVSGIGPPDYGFINSVLEPHEYNEGPISLYLAEGSFTAGSKDILPEGSKYTSAGAFPLAARGSIGSFLYFSATFPYAEANVSGDYGSLLPISKAMSDSFELRIFGQTIVLKENEFVGEGIYASLFNEQTSYGLDNSSAFASVLELRFENFDAGGILLNGTLSFVGAEATQNAVPEPSTLSALGAAGMGFAIQLLRRSRKKLAAAG